MPKALNLLRPGPHRRRDVFDAGLKAAGFDVVTDLQTAPAADDVLLIWNRYGGYNDWAERFEAVGARVIVAENCPLGNDFRGGSYAIACRHVAMTGGEIPEGGPERWDSFAVDLRPWRDLGGSVLILEQRGIGHPDVRSPSLWAERAQKITAGRIRRHPGNQPPTVPLHDDLRKVSHVITWSSAAAVQALIAGVPIWHEHPRFCCAAAGRPLSEWPALPRRDDEARLRVLRRLAWAIWSLDEIATGEPLRRLATLPTDGVPA